MNIQAKIIDCLWENVVRLEQGHKEINLEEIREKAENIKKSLQNDNKRFADAKRQKANDNKVGEYVVVKTLIPQRECLVNSFRNIRVHIKWVNY